jgi:hypothetical protein
MTTRHLRFDHALDDLAAQRCTLEECIERYAAEDAELAELLRVVAAAQAALVPAGELSAACVRTRARLRAAMDAAPWAVDTEPTESVGRIVQLPVNRPRIRRMSRLAPAACVAAAVLLLSMSTGLLVSAAAQGALPENPLYGVKRGEEWVALHTAWSDQRRGEALASIAAHRLAEAKAEAALHHDGMVRSLTRELDADMHELIGLTATMAAEHEDTSSVASALAQDLNAEYAAIQAARDSGQQALAAALGATTQAQQQALAQHHIQLPQTAGGPSTTPIKGTGQDHGKIGTPTSQSATPPAAGQGGGNGNGGGNGGSQGGGGGQSSGGDQGSGGSGGRAGHQRLTGQPTSPSTPKLVSHGVASTYTESCHSHPQLPSACARSHPTDGEDRAARQDDL